MPVFDISAIQGGVLLNTKQLGVVQNKVVPIDEFEFYLINKQNDKRGNTRNGDESTLDKAIRGAVILNEAQNEHSGE